MHLSMSFQSLLENAEQKDTLFLFPRSSVTWFCQSMINLPWPGEILPSFGTLPSFLSERTLTFTEHRFALCRNERVGGLLSVIALKSSYLVTNEVRNIMPI